MVGFISSSHFIDHDTGPSHPERPDRLRAIATAVRKAGLLDTPTPFPNFHMDFGSFPATEVKLLDLPAPAPADERWLRLVHPQRHIDRIRDLCDLGGGVLDDGDTPVSARSFEIAALAVGALLRACDAVIDGTVSRAFAAVRPPGHHAEADRPMGFCLLANVAIAARYLQRRHGMGKIAIVDFDVHHGNGTQAIFFADPGVLFISLHQSPESCWPGTGYASEIGSGNILNIPMVPGSRDNDYLSAFHGRVLPAIDAFKPEMLLISAGFDAHRDDPLAQIDLDEECFGAMTKLLAQAARVDAGGRMVSALEGGYNLRALGRSVVSHLVGMEET
ncbi:MAG TPA: histone deacetylase [Tepidisphaeraceae bacterium]|jgi:acetoin utilization deacetylase AcuC-like enzyme|nr:histone deacetylase [Tepidisphaeraceae bacterium]